MSDLFKEILPSITTTKKRVDISENYVPFVINKALSAYQDCIFLVNLVNMHHEISAEAHYDFLLNTVRAWKRPFVPWLKKAEADTNLETVIAYYGVSELKAQDYLSLLTNDQISQLKERMNKGGINHYDKRK